MSVADGQGRLVWLLRHAKAAEAPPPGGGDHERPLAPRGRRDAAALGALLASDGHGPRRTELPALVLSSTATRTTETAQRVAGALGLGVDRRRRLYYGSPDDVLDEVRTLDDVLRSIMVVGHNPAIHSVALELLSDEDEDGRQTLETRGFPTCALAVVHIDAERWRDCAFGSGILVGFLTPPY